MLGKLADGGQREGWNQLQSVGFFPLSQPCVGELAAGFFEQVELGEVSTRQLTQFHSTKSC